MLSLNNTRNKLVGVIIVEGSLVMAIELLIGKFIESYFGTMLSAWTTTLGVTLLGISLGYFVGGIWSKSANSINDLAKSFLGASIALLFSVIALPYSTHLITLTDSLQLALILTGFLTLMIPLFFLGTIPPIVIKLITDSHISSGESTGNVYSISALVGVFSTLITGNIVIEYFGIFRPLLIIFMILWILGVALLNKSLIIKLITLFIFGSICIFVPIVTESSLVLTSDDLIYEEEGLLGQVRILDRELDNQSISFHRILNINNIPQSIVMGGDQATTSAYKYVHLVSSLTTSLPINSDVLLCGLAAGSLVSELTRLGNSVEVVDIDPRMKYIAEEYFYLDEDSYTFTADDARHFIRATNKTYDLVIIDISASESQPTYLYTIESFKRIKEILSDEGMLIVNFQSNYNQEYDNPANLIFQTMHHAGFKTRGVVMNEDIKDDIIFIGSQEVKYDFDDMDLTRVNSCCMKNSYVQDYILKKVYVDPVIVDPPLYLTDDLPVLETLKNEMLIKNRIALIKSLKQ